MEAYKYRIDIEGYPCQRPRLGKFGNTHNSPKYHKYKKDLTYLLKALHIPKNDYDYVCLRFFYPYPKATPKKNRIDNEPMRYKYDIDNLVKTFLDALQDAEIIEDDRRISGIYAEKLFTISDNGWIDFDFE